MKELDFPRWVMLPLGAVSLGELGSRSIVAYKGDRPPSIEESVIGCSCWPACSKAALWPKQMAIKALNAEIEECYSRTAQISAKLMVRR